VKMVKGAGSRFLTRWQNDSSAIDTICLTATPEAVDIAGCGSNILARMRDRAETFEGHRGSFNPLARNEKQRRGDACFFRFS